MNQSGSSKKYIILAEDDEDDRLIFKEAVNELSSPFEIRIAEDGFELLNFLEKPNIELPHLVLLDLNMPLINGFECLETMKKDERLRHIPVIIYSTSGNTEDIEKAYSLGANYYLSKPESYAQLKEVIQKVLETNWTIAINQSNKPF